MRQLQQPASRGLRIRGYQGRRLQKRGVQRREIRGSEARQNNKVAAKDRCQHGNQIGGLRGGDIYRGDIVQAVLQKLGDRSGLVSQARVRAAAGVWNRSGNAEQAARQQRIANRVRCAGEASCFGVQVGRSSLQVLCCFFRAGTEFSNRNDASSFGGGDLRDSHVLGRESTSGTDQCPE